MKTARRSGIALANLTLLGLALATSNRAADVNSVWNGVTGNWSTRTNWTPNANYPNNGNGGLTYNARVSAGAVTLTEPIVIQQYTNAGGTLAGDFPLTINELFTWSGGTLTGTGTPNSALNLLAGATWSGATKTITGRTISLSAGTVTWNAGNINIGGNSVLNIGAAAVFDTTFNATLNLSPADTAAIVNNSGIFRKSGSTGTATIEAILNNPSGAVVEVRNGVLNLAGGGTGGGSYTNAPGATLQFGGGTHNLTDSSSVTGAGTNRVSAGTLDMAGTYDMSAGSTAVSGGTVNFTGQTTRPGALILSGTGAVNFNTTNSGTGLTMTSANISGGTLGGTDNLNVTGSFTWAGGAIGGSGTVRALGGMTLNGATKSLTGRMLRIAPNSTATWGAGTINSGQGAALSIDALAVFDNNFDGQYQFNLGGSSVITNRGTFRKSGGLATTTVAPPFNNLGAVEVNSGTLNLTGGGASSGSFTSAAGATLQFGGGNHSLEITSAISGAGTNSVSAGSVSFGGSYNVTGATRISGGSASFIAPITSVGSLTVSGGTASFASGNAISASSLALSGGTLSGTDTLNVSGGFTWSGGTLSGSGALNANGAATFSTASHTLSGRTLNLNSGNTIWSAGNINSGQGSVLNIAGGAVLDNSFDGSYLLNQGGSSSITNRGTFRKSGGVGVNGTAIGAIFNNASTGVVEANSGALSLNGGGSGSGRFTVASGAILAFGGGTHNLDVNTVVNGPGDFRVTSGTLNLAGAYNVTGPTTVSGNSTANFAGPSTGGGSLTVSGGTAAFNGTANVNFSSLTLSGAGTLAGTNDVSISGPFTWNGGTLSGSGRVLANGGATFGTASRTLSGRTVLVPNGQTALWVAGDFGTGQGAVLDNAGLVDLAFDGQYVLSLGGASTIKNRGTFRKSTGNGITTISVAFDNTGLLEVNSGRVDLAGGGTGTGSYSVGATRTLGFISGSHNLGPGSIISGAGNVSFQGGSVDFAGTFNVTGSAAFNGGTVNFNPGSILTSLGPTPTINGSIVTFNRGTNATLPALMLSGGYLGGSDIVNVTGLFSWGGGTLSGAGVLNANGGATLNGFDRAIEARTLNLFGTSTWSAGFINTANGAVLHIQPGATLLNSFDGGIGGFLGTRSITNAGTFRKNGGTGTTSVNDPFLNMGTVEVNTGLLGFAQECTQTAGTMFLKGGSFSFGPGLGLLGGTLKGTGAITGSVTNAAAVSPGASIGSLALAGDYIQTSAGALNIELGGTVPGTGHDQLNISGQVTLAGALNVTLTNGFLPSIGDSFRILSFTSRAGDFASFTGFDLGAQDRHLEAVYDTTGLTLVTRTGPIGGPPIQVLLLPPSTLQFTWPSQNSDYQLESTTNLVAPNWQAFGSGGTNSVFFVVNPAERERYFRLHKP